MLQKTGQNQQNDSCVKRKTKPVRDIFTGSVKAPHLPGKAMKCWQRAFLYGPANKDGQNRGVHKAKVQTSFILASSWLGCAWLFALSNVLFLWLYKQNTTQLRPGKSFKFYRAVGCTEWENSACRNWTNRGSRRNSSECWVEAALGRAALGALRSHWAPGSNLRGVRREQCAEHTGSCGEHRTTESQNCLGWKRPLRSVSPSVKSIKININIWKCKLKKNINT